MTENLLERNDLIRLWHQFGNIIREKIPCIIHSLILDAQSFESLILLDNLK